MNLDTYIQNLPARMRGQTNRYRFGKKTDPSELIEWLRSEASKVQHEYNRQQQLENQLKMGTGE